MHNRLNFFLPSRQSTQQRHDAAARYTTPADSRLKLFFYYYYCQTIQGFSYVSILNMYEALIVF